MRQKIGGDCYAANIAWIAELIAGTEVFTAFKTLERLRKKGYLTSRSDFRSPGQSKRKLAFFSITDVGKKELEHMEKILHIAMKKT